jgi:MFS family permease
MNVGAMAGALGAAPIANGVGRRKCLIATGVVFALGYALLAFCHGFPALLIARMITGLGSGMASFIVPLYIAEVAKTSRRGTLGASNQLAIVVGIFLAYGLASWIQMDAPTGDAIPPDFTNNLDGKPPPTKVCNYQVFSGVIACIGGLLAGLSFFVPETPRWLFMKSRTQDGEWALQKLRGDDFMQERSQLQMSATPSTEEATESLMDYKRQLFIGVMLQVFQQFSGVNNIMFYLTSILQNNGVSNPEMYSTITMLLQIIFTAISCVLMDKAGRRGLLMLSQFGLAVGMAFFSSKFLFNVDGKLFQTFSLQI